MADFPHFTKLLHFRSPSLSSSPLFFPLHHLSLRRRLSLSTVHLSTSPNLLLLSTSLESDGSLVFKFGDAGELPPDTTSSDGDGIEVENDGDLVAVDRLHSVEDDVEDSTVEDNTLSSVGAGIVVTSEIDQIDGDLAVVDPIEVESDRIVKDDEHNHDDVVVTSSEVVDYAAAPSMNHDLAVVDQIEVESDEIAKDDEQNHDDIVVTSSEVVDNAAAPSMNHDLAVVDQIEAESKIESDEIAVDDEQNHDDVVVTSAEVEDSAAAPCMNNDDAIVITDDNFGLDDDEIDVKNLNSTGEVALEDKEVDDDESVKISVVEHDNGDDEDGDDETVGLPVLQLEAEPVLDEEVDDASVPSIGRMEDPTMGDHADEAVTSTETTVDRALPSEEISSDGGDISEISFSMSSASVSPLKVDIVLPSAMQYDNCTESRDISESSGLDSNSSDTVSAEANPDSVQIPTVEIAMPSASLAKEVNDAATLVSTQQSDDIYTAADLGPGISATKEISLREEISAPSLCLVSAAASLAHAAEALAGRDDAFFVCENWFGVADGVGQWSFGGINKVLYAQEFIRNCESLATKSLNTGLNGFKELFQESAAMTESPGATRVLIAHVAEQVLHVANVGDTGFIIIRDGTVFMKSSPMFHEFNFPHAISSGDDPLEVAEEYHVELKDGDIIVTATDGLFDNLYEHEIASLVGEALEDGKNVKDIAELLASRSQEVGRSPDARTPFADAAQAAGHTEISGGKFDHVTVIVSAVKKG